MGGAVQQAGSSQRGRRGRRRGARSRVMSEINVTPFVDVMLVLLIVFMVAAPLSVTGVPVELSKTAATSLAAPQEKPLSITITKSGEVYVQSKAVLHENLLEKLEAVAGERKDDKIFLRADAEVAWERIAQVMGALNRAGFTSIGFVTSEGGPRLTGQATGQATGQGG